MSGAAPSRRWTFRLIDFGLAHDGSHRGVSMCRVFEVDGRPVTSDCGAVEITGGRWEGEETSAVALERVALRVAACAEALGRPVIQGQDSLRGSGFDWPAEDERVPEWMYR